MSPRRKFRPGERPLLVTHVPPRRPWAFPLAISLTALLMAGAIGACAWMLISHEDQVGAASKNRAVVSYVTGFMTQFTSIDPYHANDYVEGILRQGTGDFAKQFRDDENQILIQVAQAEPATGAVVDAGVERWNDDGSASVIVVTAVTTKSPDEKQAVGNMIRWAAIATQEGSQWKISNLQRVI